MKNTVILAVAGLVALVLGFSASLSTPTAHAEVTGSVAIGCEFLIGSIDGNSDDASVAQDATDACDGLSAADIANLANTLGDEDDRLEVADFDDVDLDANQLTDEGAGISDEIYVIVFVDDDAITTIDADAGVTVAINDDGVNLAGADDANAETCEADDDLDCDTSTPSSDDGDGVVVATVTEETADDDDEIDVDSFQADATSEVSTQVLSIQGAADEVELVVLGKTTIQANSSATTALACSNEGEVTDTDQLGDVDKTFVAAIVTDNDGDELTRIAVLYSVDDTDVALIDNDSGEAGSDPNGDTAITVDGGAAGIASFAVVCGGQDTGTATVTATINDNTAAEEDTSVEIEVVDEPADIALTVAPAAIDCNGTSTATVTATVTDADGNNVADGTNVEFSVVALGTANPINEATVDGVASSTITPLSAAVAGVTVIVTSGDAQASTRVDCNTPAAQPTPGGPGPVATPTRTGGTGVIGGPDTGNGGYLGQDSTGGFPMWTLVALGLGAVALAGGGIVARRTSR